MTKININFIKYKERVTDMKNILTIFTLLYICAGCGSGNRYRNNVVGKQPRNALQFLKEKLDLPEGTLLQIVQDIKSAEKDRNYVRASQLKLNLNYMFEKQESDENHIIDRKYRALNKILQAKIKKFNSQIEERLEDSQVETTHRNLYNDLKLSMIYHPLVLNEVHKVFRNFGYLYINETLDKEGSPIAKQVKVKRPWSGFWYPFSNDVLYKDYNSPLGKYDQLVLKLDQTSSSRDEEQNYYKGFSPTSWEGLCDAWAIASIITEEPTEPKTIMGIKFSVPDLKALLTFSHQKYPYKQYGITYRGNAETDGTFQDIKPEAFHKIIVSVLKKQKRAVVIDDMAGVEVWNKPLFRYRWKVVKDPENNDAFLVKGYPWLVRERSKETDKPTSLMDTVAPVYSYRLYVDKETVKNNKYLVVAGEWIGDSYKDHSDTVKVLDNNGAIGSHNKEFNKNIEIYKRYLLNS